jgi:hypothetical protein
MGGSLAPGERAAKKVLPLHHADIPLDLSFRLRSVFHAAFHAAFQPAFQATFVLPQ